MAQSRRESQEDYTRHIEARQRVAASQLPSTPIIQRQSVSCQPSSSATSQPSSSATSRRTAHDLLRADARLHNPFVPLNVDSSASESNDSDDSDSDDSLFHSSTNRFNSNSHVLLQVDSDESTQNTTTITAASNATSNLNNTLPPPSNPSNTNDNTTTPPPTSLTISYIASLFPSRATPTTTNTPTTIQPTTVAQLSKHATVPPVRANVENRGRSRLLPVLPSFITNPGCGLCVSIMAVAKANRFEKLLIHGKRTDWFADKSASFHAAGGILCHYRHTAPL